MPLSSLTITITDPRIIDGWVEAANRNGTSPEAIAGEFLAQQGGSYANLFNLGVITSAAFMARFKPGEYAAIMTAADESPEVAGYINELVAHPTVPLYDPRLRGAVEALAGGGLINPERVDAILAYDRPEAPHVNEAYVVVPAPQDNDTTGEGEV